MAFLGHGQVSGDARLAARIFGRGRQRAFRPGFTGGLEIDQQRRQRVRGRRATEFDLATFGQGAVAGNQPGDGCAQLVQQRLAIGQREIDTLGHQFGNGLSVAAQALTAPGQQVPGGQIGEIGARKMAEGVAVVGAHAGQHVAQAPVGGERLDHGRCVAAEGHVEQPVAIRGRQVVRVWIAGDAQQGIAPLSGRELVRVILDLVEQNRHEIDRAADARMALQVRCHVGIVLDGVQQHPGQDELAAFRMPVVRLMHVPEEGEIGHQLLDAAP